MTRCVYPVRTGARFEIRLGYLSERATEVFEQTRVSSISRSGGGGGSCGDDYCDGELERRLAAGFREWTE